MLLNILTWLKEKDTQLFLKINNEWTCSFLDNIFPWWRMQSSWYFLYAILITFVIWKLHKKAWWHLLCAAITVAATDGVSSHLLKKSIERPRPCKDPLLMDQVRLLVEYCSGGYSFTSSHAANHFGIACFLFFTLKPHLGNRRYLFLFWAASIGYAQIYVGVHYPLDVLCGTIVGCTIGYGTSVLWKKHEAKIKK